MGSRCAALVALRALWSSLTSRSAGKYILDEKESPTFVSSTILLAAGDGIATTIAGPPLRKSKRAPRGRAAKKEAKDEAKRVWALASSAEAEALVARYVNQRE